MQFGKEHTFASPRAWIQFTNRAFKFLPLAYWHLLFRFYFECGRKMVFQTLLCNRMDGWGQVTVQPRQNKIRVLSLTRQFLGLSLKWREKKRCRQGLDSNQGRKKRRWNNEHPNKYRVNWVSLRQEVWGTQITQYIKRRHSRDLCR